MEISKSLKHYFQIVQELTGISDHDVQTEMECGLRIFAKYNWDAHLGAIANKVLMSHELEDSEQFLLEETFQAKALTGPVKTPTASEIIDCFIEYRGHFPEENSGEPVTVGEFTKAKSIWESAQP